MISFREHLRTWTVIRSGAMGTPDVLEGRYASFMQLDIDESPDGIAGKSKKSGISSEVLNKVYERGFKAWKTSHRAGTTPQQWAMARVNSFIAKKGSGKLNHDKDLI